MACSSAASCADVISVKLKSRLGCICRKSHCMSRSCKSVVLWSCASAVGIAGSWSIAEVRSWYSSTLQMRVGNGLHTAGLNVPMQPSVRTDALRALRQYSSCWMRLQHNLVGASWCLPYTIRSQRIPDARRDDFRADTNADSSRSQLSI